MSDSAPQLTAAQIATEQRAAQLQKLREERAPKLSYLAYGGASRVGLKPSLSLAHLPLTATL